MKGSDDPACLITALTYYYDIVTYYYDIERSINH